MSRSEWERGTLKIPTKAWKPLRDGLATAFNKRQAQLYELALKLHAMLMAQKKLAKRGAFKLPEAYQALAWKQPSVWPQSLNGSDERDLVETSLLGPFGKRTGNLLLPKKKDFPLAVATKTTQYDADLGTITLDPAKHELHWDVSENNHAVDSSRDSYMGRTLFSLLGKIEWTRGSGGTFIGNDENNQDSGRDYEGGGGSYVTATYAMKTKADLEAEAQQRRAMNRSYPIYGYGRR
jgi:hypothetical protein